MTNLEQHDLLLTTQSWNSVRAYTDPIPIDILIDIFSRVPPKSIFRFRCLSKFWSSTLGLPYFTDLFLTNSLARPRLLFGIKVDKELFFFSSPQPQNPADNSTLVATRYNRCFLNYLPSGIRTPHRGLVSLHEWGSDVHVICNPVTGESITLPEVKAKSGNGRSYVGYDHINKQFKVLCTTYGEPDGHWVLTLRSTGKPVWRSIECSHQHPMLTGISFRHEIWINDVLYYGAHSGRCNMIVCFDFCSEKFSFIWIHEEMSDGTLINYKGNLGLLVKHEYGVVLWVLEEDAGNHKWSKRMSVVLSSLYDEVGIRAHVVGMTGACEIVLLPYRQSSPFHLFYFNIERSTFTRVN
ncbi:unnamed protein product [Microthlaspi erraticum]|uniref:F-box domain-containing protein n=1 Tax=Microthlaspi erraticum TaxID=1685480 RepID=A0A6D2HCQ2_9BRAS|nr:unnamed protein product [Microthlaspi erraticum]